MLRCQVGRCVFPFVGGVFPAVGIAEGRGAGVWTIGIAASGNGVGLSAEAFAALIQSDTIKWARVIKSTGIRLDGQ